MESGENSTLSATDTEEYVFPVTFAQQRLLFVHELDPHSTAYSVPMSFHVRGDLDVLALEQTLNEIVRRHEVLRTTFRFVDGEPMQVVSAPNYFPLQVADLSRFDDSHRQAQDMTTAEARQPLDLEKGPTLRAKLLRLNASEHVLLLTLHHIVFDGWSRSIFYGELDALYDAFRGGHKGSPLPELELQYPDYAVWQRNHLQGPVLRELLDYWKRELEGAPTELRLLGKSPRVQAASFPGASVPLDLPVDLPRQVNECARCTGATPFMVWLASFAVLLARYTSLDEFLIGTPIANRNQAGVEGLIGLFANMLPLRVSVAENPTFRQLIGQVKETCLRAYAHQDIPFERIVEELQPSRQANRNPLVQVLFALQNTPRRPMRLGELELKPFEGGAAPTAKFDLSFFLQDRESGGKLRIEYNSDLLERADVESMGHQYIELASAAVAGLETPVFDLPTLTGEERARVLKQWNATAAEYPRTLCAYQLFEQQVEQTPQAIACQCDEDQISYETLNQRANQAARFLRRHGVGPGDRVGVFIDRSLHLPVALLAVQKCGAAYVPLDPSVPPERLRTMVEDASPRWILTQQSLEDLVSGLNATLFRLDSDWSQAAAEPVLNLTPSAHPDDPMYVIFTSGSTGRPKGVQVAHKSVVNVLSFMARELRLGSEDVFPCLASCAWDMSVPELYLPLIAGGRTLIVRREHTYDGEALAGLLVRSGATVLHATPTTWSLLLDAGFTGKGLKRVCGADKISSDLCERMLRTGGEFYNFFGPTETTVWSTFHVVRSLAERDVIGRPLANTEVYVLDQSLRPVPVGVSGEICIGGEGVAIGYLGDENLTATKFVLDPYSGRPGGRLYRTGDLGRYLPDGRIEFCGRGDSQVKMRGFRVELGEIEAVVARHPSVKECVVVAREDAPGDMRIVAYVTGAPGSDVDSGRLREWTKQHLPQHMIPRSWVVLAALPVSANGKLDRNKLPEPVDTIAMSGERVAADSPLESILLLAWEQALGVAGIGVSDNFFDLGGHSLLAVKLLARIEKLIGRKVPLATLFRGQTVAEMAKYLEETPKFGGEPLVTELQRGTSRRPFFVIAAPGVRTLGYALLARHLGIEQPFYKIQAQSPVARDRLLTEDELCALASQYIQGIRTIQPEGPYSFGAMCAGCRIVEQMILQLEAAGEEVMFFAVFDTWVIENVNRPWLWKAYYYQQRLRSFWKSKGPDKLHMVRNAVENRIRKSPVLPVTNQSHTDWKQALWPKDYTPTRFQTPITLFRRRKQPFYYIDDPKMGWESRTHSGVEVHEIELEGLQHLEILRDPSVRVLAERLSDCLRRVAPSAAHRNAAGFSPFNAHGAATGKGS